MRKALQLGRVVGLSQTSRQRPREPSLPPRACPEFRHLFVFSLRAEGA